jgi:hypothetical protein
MKQNEYFRKITDDFFEWCSLHGITLRAAAFIVGVCHPYLVEIGKGKRPPSGKTIHKMILVMDRSVCCKE